MTTRLGPDELAALEEERNFLLRSLDDLERERAEGNIDDGDYERLRDDYTARAAATIRSIEDHLDERSAAPPVSARRRVAVIAGVALFAAVAAVLLTRSLGERLPGESVTGNAQTANEQTSSPYERLIADADRLVGEGEAAEALRRYDEAAALDPGRAEARARGALIVFRAGLVDEALDRLDAAEAADPTFPETWFVRGIVLVQGKRDTDGGRTAFTRYLELAPDGPYAEDARVILDELDDKPDKPDNQESG